MIYDAEKNTIDGKPLSEWKKANSPMICPSCLKEHPTGSRFCADCGRMLAVNKRVEPEKLYWGYGFLVVSAISILVWFFSEGWKYAAVGIYLAWPLISFVLIFLAAKYILKSVFFPEN